MKSYGDTSKMKTILSKADIPIKVFREEIETMRKIQDWRNSLSKEPFSNAYNKYF